MVRAWIRKDKIINGMVEGQSIDHYATVLQIAGYLALHGIRVDINHNQGADVVAYFQDETVSFEYERPGSHNVPELQEKKHNINSRRMVFIGTTENINHLSEAVGVENTVKRGSQLLILIDELIEQNTKKTIGIKP